MRGLELFWAIDVMIGIVCGACIIIYLVYTITNHIYVRYKIRHLANDALTVSPKEFFKIRKSKEVGGTKHDFAGIYIIYNCSKKMHYVGQSKRVLYRVNQHFTGRGNGDVYADYKYGDDFWIKMIALKTSGFRTLNGLERNAIKVHRAYSRGYNKTRGNRG